MGTIIDQLASRTGERGSKANKTVAATCATEPELLVTIAAHLNTGDIKLSVDCAEVMTEVALINPALVAPYAIDLIPLFNSKHTFAKFEALHAIALVAALAPEVVSTIFPELQKASALTEKSVIARDRATETFANYASVSEKAAKAAYPYLMEIIDNWQDRHAHQAMRGLAHVARWIPSTTKEILRTASLFTESERGVVKKEALKLIKKLSPKP